jgi:hypothetical protein
MTLNLPLSLNNEWNFISEKNQSLVIKVTEKLILQDDFPVFKLEYWIDSSKKSEKWLQNDFGKVVEYYIYRGDDLVQIRAKNTKYSKVNKDEWVNSDFVGIDSWLQNEYSEYLEEENQYEICDIINSNNDTNKIRVENWEFDFVSIFIDEDALNKEWSMGPIDISKNRLKKLKESINVEDKLYDCCVFECQNFDYVNDLFKTDFYNKEEYYINDEVGFVKIIYNDDIVFKISSYSVGK